MRDEDDFSKARRGPAIPLPEMTPVQDATRRQQAADALLSIADCVAEAGIEPMSMEDIQAEEFILKDVAWGLRGPD